MIHTRAQGAVVGTDGTAVHQDGREYDVFKAVSTSSRQGYIHPWSGFRGRGGDIRAWTSPDVRTCYVYARHVWRRGPLRFSFLFRQVDRKSHGDTVKTDRQFTCVPAFSLIPDKYASVVHFALFIFFVFYLWHFFFYRKEVETIDTSDTFFISRKLFHFRIYNDMKVSEIDIANRYFSSAKS